MRRIRFYFLILIAIVWFVVFLPYFLVQTSWGANIFSQQLSKFSGYTISIGHVHHSIFQPYEVTLDDLVVSKNENEPQEIVNISKLVIGIDKQDPWQIQHFDYIVVTDGIINNISNNISNIKEMITANTVKLVNSTINLHLDGEQFSLQHVNGGFKPFTASGEPYQFDLTSQTVLFNNFPLKSVLIQGFQRDGVINLINVGGNINNGFFVSKLNILPDNSLDIAQLKINNINFQSAIEQRGLSEFFETLPKLTIRQFSLIDSSLNIPNFSIEKGNIEATNLRYDETWDLNQGSLIFNADTVVWNDDIFSSPLIQLQSDKDRITIERAIATWNKGNVNFTGSWQNNQLQLNQLIIAGVRYQLPEQIDALLLPEMFNQITIDNLMILPSLVIGTNPDYPFVVTNFEISGTNVTIVQDRKLGLYSGTLFSKSESGSFRGVAIKYPDLSIQFLSDNSGVFKFSTLLDQGMFESTAIIDPAQTEFTALRVNAYNVNSNILTKWQFAKNPPAANNFTADLTGKIAPFSLSGTISANGNNYSIESQH